MQEYTIRRTKRGYELGLKDITGEAGSLKWFIEENKHNLRYADLQGAPLGCTDLSFSDLSFSDLRGADLSCTNLSGANLIGANLSGANLIGTYNFIGKYILKNIYNYTFIKTNETFLECFIAIRCKTKRIKDWNIFFSDESKEEYETSRSSEKFQEIKKEYFEALQEFKIRFKKS